MTTRSFLTPALALAAASFCGPVFARDILVCNYIGAPSAQTKPHEIAPGTMLRCKDKESKDIPNSLAGLYSSGYRLISAVSFESQFEGKKVLVLQFFLEK
jgi:hypothetical protein